MGFQNYLTMIVLDRRSLNRMWTRSALRAVCFGLVITGGSCYAFAAQGEKPADAATQPLPQGNGLAAAREAIRSHRRIARCRRTEARPRQGSYWVGSALEEEGQLDAAAEQFRAAVALQPQEVQPHLKLAAVLRKQRYWSAALREYQTVLKLQPGNAEAHNGLGRVLVEKGDLPGGIAEIRRAVELAPQSPQYHTNLGVVLSTGDKAEAVRQFRKALAIDPSFCLAEYNLGAALQQQNGMLNGGSQIFEQCGKMPA